MTRESDLPDIRHFDPDYLVTLDEIFHSHWAARKRRRIFLLERAIDHFWPEGHPTRFLHITGTNGKGSVAYYLEQAFRFAGNTGSWTGPHVFDYAERFHVNAMAASHQEIVDIYRQHLEPYQRRAAEIDESQVLSFAELGILTAMFLFQRHRVAWAVMEVGAGGRYTPLMALQVAGCILTNVGHDHPRSLGVARWQRALEKAGIARPDLPFFTSVDALMLPYVARIVAQRGGRMIAVDQADRKGIEAAEPSPLPTHQIENLALVIKIVSFFFATRTPQQILASISQDLPARMTVVRPQIVADMAHNEDKMRGLADALKRRYPTKRFVFLLGLTRSRDPLEVFGPILPLAHRIVLCRASYLGRDPHELASQLEGLGPEIDVVEDPQEALAREESQLAEDEILVLTGSGYLIDQALNPNPFLAHLNRTYGWRTATDGLV